MQRVGPRRYCARRSFSRIATPVIHKVLHISTFWLVLLCFQLSKWVQYSHLQHLTHISKDIPAKLVQEMRSSLKISEYACLFSAVKHALKNGTLENKPFHCTKTPFWKPYFEKCTAPTPRSSGSNLTGNTHMHMHWENLPFKLCIKAYGEYINANLNRPIRGLVTMGKICSFINILPSLSVFLYMCVCAREIKSNKWKPLLLFSWLYCKGKDLYGVNLRPSKSL